VQKPIRSLMCTMLGAFVSALGEAVVISNHPPQKIALIPCDGADLPIDKPDIASPATSATHGDTEVLAAAFDLEKLTLILHEGVLLEGPPKTSRIPQSASGFSGLIQTDSPPLDLEI
jgi:hypothetical protein